MFDDYQHDGSAKTAKRRFGASMAGAIVVYGLIGGLIVAATAATRAAVRQDELAQVEFAPPPPPPPPPPAPPPPPMVEPRRPPPPRSAPPPPNLVAPDEIRNERPDESDAALVDAPPAGPVEGDLSGAVGGVSGGEHSAPAAVAPPPPPPPPPPAPQRPRGPIQQPENATAPTPLSSNEAVPYPEAARSQAIRATVIVKLGIGEDGRVLSAEVLRGHPLFDDTVLRVVRGWRFNPARLPDGEAISVFKVLPIRFQVE